jgi:hypothetical protein
MVVSTLIPKKWIQQKSPSLCCRDQWLAGLIDGDGCFYKTKPRCKSVLKSQWQDDQHLLQEVQQMIGGILKPERSENRLRIFS